MIFFTEIRTPDREVFKGEIDELHIPTYKGNLTILPKYTDFMTIIIPGSMKVVINKEIKEYFIAKGILTVKDKKVTVIAEAIENAKDINIQRALKAKERATRRLKEKGEDIDFKRAEAALHRAIERIKIAERHQI